MDSLYVIGDHPAFTPQIARLVSMMTYVRKTTIDAVEELSVEQLDRVVDNDANSIGALLMHIAAVETAYQAMTFGWAEDMARWQVALDLGQRARDEIRGHDAAHYISILKEVREKTLVEFAKRDDDWLMEESTTARGRMNNYWKWFHVFEDELNHRGQIRFLRKRV